MTLILLLGCADSAKESPPPTLPTTATDSGATTTTAPFVDVEVGGPTVCALDAVGAASCWDIDTGADVSTPGGPFTALTVGLGVACGERAELDWECWGDLGELGLQSAYAWAQIDLNLHLGCGIDPSGELACWDDGAGTNYGEDQPPEGSFATVRAGLVIGCALDDAGHATCWGSDAWGQLDTPDERLIDLDVGVAYACGLSETAEPICWGQDLAGEVSEPWGGPFGKIIAGDTTTCALRESGTFECWGTYEEDPEFPTDILDLSISAYNLCVATEDGEVACREL